MGIYMLQLGNGQTATIEYNFGGSVEEINQYQLTADAFRQRNIFRCSSTLQVTLSANLPQPLEFGFIANVLSSERNGYYNSSTRTRVKHAMPIQCLDGDGQDVPFAVAHTDSPTQAGTHPLTLQYADQPFVEFPRKAHDALNEGNTLVRVDGQDVHQIWLVVGDPISQGLIRIATLRWVVQWFATIDNTTDQVAQTPAQSGAGLEDVAMNVVTPVFNGQLVNNLYQTTVTTW